MLVRRFPRPMSVASVNDLDRIFDSLFGSAARQFACAPGACDPASIDHIAPALNVWEDEQSIHVEAELPGVDPDKIDVKVHGDVLTLSGSKDETHEEKRKNVYRSERVFGSFLREITLPDVADQEKVNAEFKNGVLCVTLKKKPGNSARKIPVVPRN